MTETVPPSPVEVFGFAVSHEKAPDIEPRHQEKRNPFPPSISPVMFGPNISGKFGASKGGDNQAFAEGAFYIDVRNKFGAEGAQNSGLHYGFDASRSVDVFGGSTTVQPTSLRLLPCIKA